MSKTVRRNPVAKYMNEFNKPVKMRDKKKDYKRKPKNKKAMEYEY